MLPNLILTVILLISLTVTTADYFRPQPRETLHFQWSPKPSSYPQQVHISLAGDEYMRVTWVTDDQSSPSIVEYGTSPGRYSSVAQGETKIVEYLVEPILNQFDYLINFNDNVEDLTKQVEKLEAINLKVKQLIEIARRNAEDIKLDVERWLSNVDEIIQCPKIKACSPIVANIEPYDPVFIYAFQFIVCHWGLLV
uniref:Purple acid phosphatase N-terminal domain-containing protein n=1 Tax=Fagus sylvatica TaxID=28930 RepID=A0A2N9F951_FAGSY